MAQELFLQKGMENTTMSEIAREAGYSKATLYVYFKNKEELIGFLVLESMQKLYESIAEAVKQGEDIRESYQKICEGLVTYQEEFPLYFQLIQQTIQVDFTSDRFLLEEKETFLIGEKINTVLSDFIKKGIRQGVFPEQIEILPTIFTFWGMLLGVIQIAANKEAYIRQRMGKTKQEFLDGAFAQMYQSLRNHDFANVVTDRYKN